MKYQHRDRANRAVPVLCGIVLGTVDLALVIGAPGFSWGLRLAILAALAFAAMFTVAAVTQRRERAGWLSLLAGFAALTCFPPARFVPGRLIFGSLLLAGLLGLLVWHARKKRTALWSET